MWRQFQECLWCPSYYGSRKITKLYHLWIFWKFLLSQWQVNTVLLRSEIPSGMCAKLRTVAASNNRNHARNLLLLLARATYIVLFFPHIPFVVNHTVNATPPERLQQHPLIFTTNHTDRTLFVWRLNSARPSHPGHSTILLTCLSLCNTHARAVNLIHAILCDDEGVTQARGC